MARGGVCGAADFHDGELAIHDSELAASHNHSEAAAALVRLGGGGGAVDPVHYTVDQAGADADPFGENHKRLSSSQQNIVGNIRATQQGIRAQQIPFYEVQPGSKISK
ncbi:unnamed protein product [Miscanthus lutarioriparius]|uniref:Uncharacterized protein n=1 Tax=Miscanthus lutarioriparius TaxID=422564 RepID=A0A811QWE8_9POAL|nr:unnamed protein product [Miscanthus lutarioriparius]